MTSLLKTVGLELAVLVAIRNLVLRGAAREFVSSRSPGRDPAPEGPARHPDSGAKGSR